MAFYRQTLLATAAMLSVAGFNSAAKTVAAQTPASPLPTAQPAAKIEDKNISPQSDQRPLKNLEPATIAAEYAKTYQEYYQWLPHTTAEFRPALLILDNNKDNRSLYLTKNNLYQINSVTKAPALDNEPDEYVTTKDGAVVNYTAIKKLLNIEQPQDIKTFKDKAGAVLNEDQFRNALEAQGYKGLGAIIDDEPRLKLAYYTQLCTCADLLMRIDQTIIKGDANISVRGLRQKSIQTLVKSLGYILACGKKSDIMKDDNKDLKSLSAQTNLPTIFFEIIQLLFSQNGKFHSDINTVAVLFGKASEPTITTNEESETIFPRGAPPAPIFAKQPLAIAANGNFTWSGLADESIAAVDKRNFDLISNATKIALAILKIFESKMKLATSIQLLDTADILNPEQITQAVIDQEAQDASPAFIPVANVFDIQTGFAKTECGSHITPFDKRLDDPNFPATQPFCANPIIKKTIGRGYDLDYLSSDSEINKIHFAGSGNSNLSAYTWADAINDYALTALSVYDASVINPPKTAAAPAPY